MKEKNQRLIDELDKLITNILSKDGDVILPNIGSFKIEVDKDSTSRTIVFSSEISSHTIVNTISERGNCTLEQADKVYKKWLLEVTDGDVVEIDSLGTIKGGVFTINSKTFNRLNPIIKRAEDKKVEVVEQRPKVSKADPKKGKGDSKGGKQWSILALIAVLIAIIAVVIITSDKKEDVVSETITETVKQDVVESPQPTPTPKVEPIKESPKETIKEASIETKLKTSARSASSKDAIAEFDETIANSTSPRRYRVVCGVLKSRVNAGRLVLDIKKLAAKNSDLNEVATPHIYPRNGGYMVTIFEGDSFKVCADFINRNSSALYDGMWVYDQKRM